MEQTGLDYGKGKIGSLFRKIFFPTLFGMIFTALITVVDGVFVGNRVGPDGIAAVNIIAPLWMVATGIGLMLGIGASVVAGMSIANNDTRRASVVVSQAFIAGTVIMSIIVVFSLLFPIPTARLLGSSEHLMPLATDYLCWLMPGLLFLAWSSIGMMTIRLDGSPKYAMMCNVIPAIFNIVGDYILIYPCNLGIRGAAIATAGSVIAGGLIAIFYFRMSYVIKLAVNFQGFLRNVARVTAIGSSAFVTEIAMSIMMITGNFVFMKYYGDAGVAAYSIACYLFPLMFMMSNAVAQSAQPIISYNYGLALHGRVMKTFKLSIKVAILCGIIVCAGIFMGSQWLVEMFIPLATEAGQLAVKGLPIFSTCAMFFALNIVYIGYYQSIGKALRAMILTLIRGIALLIPLYFILPALFPAWGMWAAIPAAEFLTFIIIVLTSGPVWMKKE